MRPSVEREALAWFWPLCVVISMLLAPDGRAQAITVGDITVEPRDFSAGRTTAERIAKCLACHGEHAGGDIDFGPDAAFGTPALRGIQESFLKQALIDYKDGRRSNEEMNAITGMLDDETIDFMARTFAAFPAAPIKPEAERERLAREDPRFRAGRAIAWQGMPAEGVPPCVGCHGTSRENDTALGPHLAGQNLLYMTRQLEAFADDTRQTSHAVMMRPVVAGLSSDEIGAVLHYYERIIEPTRP